MCYHNFKWCQKPTYFLNHSTKNQVRRVNLFTPEAETGRSLCVPGQPGLHSKFWASQSYTVKYGLRNFKKQTNEQTRIFKGPWYNAIKSNRKRSVFSKKYSRVEEQLETFTFETLSLSYTERISQKMDRLCH